MKHTQSISVVTGDLLESGAQTLVNTVNCVGVMGKGIALAFKKYFPDMYADYEERCAHGEVRLGRPYLYKRVTAPWILNFPTKGHWRSVSRLSDIVDGLDYLEAHYREWGITSIAVPPLGCGNGQLEWDIVGPTIYRKLENFEIPVQIFAPHGTPVEKMTAGFLASSRPSTVVTNRKVDPALVALVGVISRICNEHHHWPLGRIAVQKIAYFLTDVGVPTGLKYERGSYGPFSGALKQALSNLVNHQLLVERQVGKSFRVSPGPTYRDARAMYMNELKGWSEKIERVADLFLRLPDSNAIEIAATVHFVAKELARNAEEQRVNEMQVYQEVLEWKKRRKPPFEEGLVAENIRSMNMLGWISAEASVELPIEEDCFV